MTASRETGIGDRNAPRRRSGTPHKRRRRGAPIDRDPASEQLEGENIKAERGARDVEIGEGPGGDFCIAEQLHPEEQNDVVEWRVRRVLGQGLERRHDRVIVCAIARDGKDFVEPIRVPTGK